MRPEPNTLLQALRQATSQAHTELEQTEVLSPLLRANLTQAEYIQVLRMFARFYAAADAHLMAMQSLLNEHVPDYQYEPRLPYIQQDLVALNASFSAADFTLNAPIAVGNAIGWCYVIEGSSQGGAIISRRLQQTLALTTHSGLSFFHHFSYEHNGWNILKDWLSHQSLSKTATPPNIYCEGAEQGANELFSALTILAKESSGL